MEDGVENPKSFESESGEAEVGIIREFLLFLGENKKWWLTPILVVLLLVGVLVLVGGSSLAPFIYTLW
jgi:hypothetical protein